MSFQPTEQSKHRLNELRKVIRDPSLLRPPSVDTMAAKTGLPRGAVIYYLAKLDEEGVLPAAYRRHFKL